MTTSDTSEKGLESLIVSALTSNAAGYVAGDPMDYDRDCAVDLAKLLSFLHGSREKLPSVVW